MGVFSGADELAALVGAAPGDQFQRLAAGRRAVAAWIVTGAPRTTRKPLGSISMVVWLGGR